ncbi:cyclin-dependent kinase 6 isoform X2 [Takifugu rubripes]|uniref:cyclin-dependent kinase 6 isoform X2 n=1 Tax=Takifugu rubripes TaxID=31033 RepID=UPI0002990BE2|nr:cyclin-dependent kinase 6-like isoform X2 [Takifugu rubripes]XP_056871316.1 cyclin-dependent kinase 6 isoform X2 [Takifugu flavidus]|eukprot:XP_003964954.1 PREDICTED: cyclin-dependent kinase 6-like [Takifugu rubripes]
MEVSSSPLCYELLAEIGEGSYGKVYKAREEGGKQRLLAVKKFNFRGDASQVGIPAVMVREAALMRKMKYFNHPNIVKLLDVSVVPAGRSLDLTLVLEYVDQDLSTYLSKVPASGLSRDAIKDLMQQLLRGLDFLHTNLVVHRDLKPENILVSSHGEVKIADFGLARIYSFNIALTPGVVTLWYRAPEVLLNSVYMFSVDMWSVGCIFAELFLLRPLFQGYTEVQQLQKIFEVIGFPREEDWPKESPISYSNSLRPGAACTKVLPSLGPHEQDLLSECLAFSPSSRISAAKALTHPFFTKQ